MYIIRMEWLSSLVVIFCNLCVNWKFFFGVQHFLLVVFKSFKKEKKEKKKTYTHYTVNLFAWRSSGKSWPPTWWPSPSPPESPASLGIKTSKSRDKSFGNEGTGVIKSNQACTGWHAGAVGHLDESSPLMLSLQRLPLLWKMELVRHVMIILESALSGSLVSILRLTVMTTSFSSRLSCVLVFKHFS